MFVDSFLAGSRSPLDPESSKTFILLLGRLLRGCLLALEAWLSAIVAINAMTPRQSLVLDLKFIAFNVLDTFLIFDTVFYVGFL